MGGAIEIRTRRAETQQRERCSNEHPEKPNLVGEDPSTVRAAMAKALDAGLRIRNSHLLGNNFKPFCKVGQF